MVSVQAVNIRNKFFFFILIGGIICNSSLPYLVSTWTKNWVSIFVRKMNSEIWKVHFPASVLSLNMKYCYGRILTLVYTILTDLQLAKRSLVATLCVWTATNALGLSATAPTWYLMSLPKLLHLEYWWRMFCTWRKKMIIMNLLRQISYLG